MDDRKLDALLAEKLFGLVPCQFPDHHPGSLCYAEPDKPRDGLPVEAYSTTWEGMRLVVEAMHNQLDEDGSGYYLALMYRAPDWAASFWLFIEDKDSDWYCHPERYPGSARADTAPRAVALAALKAICPEALAEAELEAVRETTS